MAPSATSLPFTELMALDRVGENTFHSRAKPYGPGLGETAFGGHVYAQAVYAASQTVAKGFVVHSVTGYFILPGLLDKPFKYTVRRVRDGGRYCLRAVEVQQASEAGPCFTCTCSFKRPEPTLFSHQPQINLQQKYLSVLKGKSPQDHPYAPGADTPWWARGIKAKSWEEKDFPGVEIRKVDMKAYNSRISSPIDYRQLQLYRLIGSIDPKDLNLHACAHLYASDRNSLFLITHALGIGDDFINMASLSHTVIFHADGEGLKMAGNQSSGNKWFAQEGWTGRTEGNRGTHESRIWDGSGMLLATTLQDGMIRIKKDMKI